MRRTGVKTMAPVRARSPSYRRFIVNGDELTPWEVRVLRLVANGWTNPRLSRRFGKSVGLFEQMRTSIYRKLGAANAPHAVKLAFECGLLKTPVRSRENPSRMPWRPAESAALSKQRTA